MTRIVVVLDGGLVQSILADGPVEVLVKDYETNGADDEDMVIDEEGNRYFSSRHSVTSDEWREQTKRVAEIFKQDDLAIVPNSKVKLVMYRTFKNYVEVPASVYLDMKAGGLKDNEAFENMEPFLDFMDKNNAWPPVEFGEEIDDAFEVVEAL